ncbi:hypothetical protein D3C72_1658180 [compost metagenome]
MREALTALLPGDAPRTGRTLVVRLSTQPVLALQQLLQLDGAVMEQLGYQRLVVLSPFAADVVRTLLVCGDMRLPVQIVNARLPVWRLCRVVLAQGTLLQEGHDHRLPRMPGRVFTPSERDVLLRTLQEIPVHLQARRRQVSAKTLYTQRNAALQKLRVSGLSALVRRCVPV